MHLLKSVPQPDGNAADAPAPLSLFEQSAVRLSPELRQWMRKPARPVLSVVIATDNVQHLIVPTIAAVAAELILGPESFEIVIADDASADDTLARCMALGLSNLVTVSMGAPRGANATLRRGMQRARGSRILTTDANMSAPLTEAATYEIPVQSMLRRVMTSRGRSRSRANERRGDCVLTAPKRLDAYSVRDISEGISASSDPTVFINLSGTRFIDEVAVNALRRTARGFERQGRELLMVWPSEAVLLTLLLLGVDLPTWPRQGSGLFHGQLSA